MEPLRTHKSTKGAEIIYWEDPGGKSPIIEFSVPIDRKTKLATSRTFNPNSPNLRAEVKNFLKPCLDFLVRPK